MLTADYNLQLLWVGGLLLLVGGTFSLGETLVLVACFVTVGPFFALFESKGSDFLLLGKLFFSSCRRFVFAFGRLSLTFCRRLAFGQWDVSGCACLGPIDSFPPCLAFGGGAFHF